MSQLTFETVPNPIDVPDSSLSVGDPLLASLLQQMNDNARTAAVRPELIYMGWYGDGDFIPLPVSPVDGYIYQRSEVRHRMQAFATSRPLVFTPGQKLRPALGPSQGLKIDSFEFDIDDSLGQALCNVTYESANPGFPGGGASGLTSDGCVKVMAICTRQSVNSDGGTN